ncbi:MAG TPA: hypothetical protein VLG09_03085, partial [Candidatus Saccharimonadales bacterium]|nr:hypothetical protein [Candidatus Saccharimonadales bacterium]
AVPMMAEQQFITIPVGENDTVDVNPWHVESLREVKDKDGNFLFLKIGMVSGTRWETHLLTKADYYVLADEATEKLRGYGSGPDSSTQTTKTTSVTVSKVNVEGDDD